MNRLNSLEDTINKQQMLFGINQGAVYPDIRIEHAKRISEMDLDGYAVGGLAVGETHEEMYYILEETVPYLPKDKPTYLMGVGTPANILEGVERGIDFFDCVYRHVTADMVTYIPIMARSICSMPNTNLTHVLSRLDVTVLHAADIPEPISDIF